MIRTLGGRLALLAAGVAAALLLGEGAAWVALRMLDGGAGRAREEQAAVARRAADPSPEGEAATAPERRSGDAPVSRVVHPFLGFVADPASHPGSNAYGLWEHPAAPDVRREPGRLAILVLGGSVAADFTRRGGRRLAERLASWAGVAAENVTFVTAAYAGYKQPQQLLALAYVLVLGGEADLVVNLDGFNEVALDASENGAQGVFPVYPRGWAWLAAQSLDLEAAADLARVGAAEARRRETAEAFRRSAWMDTHLALLAWRQVDRVLQSEVAQARRDLAARPPADRRFATAGPPSPADPDARLAMLVDYWERSSLQLDRLCRANGIRYFHFLQPNQYLEGSKPMSAAERRVALTAGHPYADSVRRGYPLLRARGAALQGAGVAFQDLTQVFARENAAVYVDDCCHMNERGYALLAEAMAEAIRARGARGAE